MSFFINILNNISKKGITNNLQENYSANTYLLKPLWFAAGADPYLLKKGTYSDQVKMACMGGTVYATALLAFISGSFAIKTIFFDSGSSSLWPYLFGVFWGVMIFNLDRFIVSSTPPNIGKKWYKKLLNAIPRILMGLVISFVISKPLELKIFEKDIQQHIAQNYDVEFKTIEDNKLKTDEVLKNIESDIERINEAIIAKNTEEKGLRERYNSEMEGKNGGVRGEGRVAKSLKEQVESSKLESLKLNSELSLLNEKRGERQLILKDEAKDEGKTIREGMGSFVKQMGIAHAISPVISWGLTILFIVLELTPIFFKLMMERAPYDFQLYDRDEVIVSRSTVYEDNEMFYSKNAQQIVAEKERELQNQNEIHIQKEEEKKRQSEEEIRKEKEVFDNNLEERMEKLAQMKKLEINNTYNSFVNSNIDHAQQKLLLDNLEIKQQYISQLEVLEKSNLERALVKSLFDLKLIAQEKIENKRLEDMQSSELEKLSLDKEYNKQLSELDKDYNAKRLSIYKDLLNKKIEKETRKFELDIQARENNRINHDSEIQDVNSRVRGDNRNDEVSTNDIKDDLIANKNYKKGDNYSEIKILNRDTVRDVNKHRNLNDNQLDILYNSEDNKIITDSKIAQFKRGKNLLDTVIDYKEKNKGIGLEFDINKATKLDKEARKVLSDKKI